MQKFKHWASIQSILFFVLFLAACQKGGGAGQSATAGIPASGGVITLERIGSATFSAGAFPSTQQVNLDTTNDPETGEMFDLTAAGFSPGKRSDYEVRINTGQTEPQGAPVTVKLIVPSGLSARLGYTVAAFARVFEGTEDELLDVFELVPTTYDAVSGSVTFDLPADYFFNSLTVDQTWEAVIMLATMPGSGSGANQMQVLANPCCDKYVPKISRPMKNLRKTSGFSNTRSNTAVGITSVGHPGVDLAAADGEAVVATVEGTVEQARDSTRDPQPNETPQERISRGLKDNGGMGGTLLIKEARCGGTLRFEHLKKGTVNLKPGDTVRPGQVIAEADSTGASTGGHLHLEYTPKGKGKIDPVPYIDTGYKGSFTYEQTGDTIFTAKGENLILDLSLDDCSGSYYNMTGTAVVTSPIDYAKANLICAALQPSGPITDPDNGITTELQIYKKDGSINNYEKYDLDFAAFWESTFECTDKETGEQTSFPGQVQVYFATFGPKCMETKLPLQDIALIKDEYSADMGCGYQELSTKVSWEFVKNPPLK